MEVIEDGNIMDRIPILLQRDLEYYQVRIKFVSNYLNCICLLLEYLINCCKLAVM